MKNFIKRTGTKSFRYLKIPFLALCVGVLCGFFGGIFHRVVEGATHLRLEHPVLIYFLPIAGLIIVLAYNSLKLNKDPGTNIILSGVRGEKKIPFVMAPLIFIATTLTHLFGGSAGREGAALQLGGAIGSKVASTARCNGKVTPLIILAGMSGAFSALFGTPLTAAIFSLEIVCIGSIIHSGIIPCFISSYISYYISKSLGNEPVRFDISSVPATTFQTVSLTILLGIVCGIVAIVFCKALKHTHSFAKKRFKNDYARIFIGGIIVVLLTIILNTRDYNGAGMDIINQALQGNSVPYAFLFKIIFTAITIGFGFKGGEIIPTFFIASTLGCTISYVIGLPPSFGAAIAIPAMFAAVVNCPISAIILALELFGNTGILMYASAIFTAFIVSGNCSLYNEQSITNSKYFYESINKKSK